MKALSVVDVKTFSLEEMEKPRAGLGNVVIKVAYCGICGSDLPRYFNGAVHSFPQILGHEFSGIVEEVGENVTSVSRGDRVAVAPLVPCGKCEFCQKGSLRCVPITVLLAQDRAVQWQNMLRCRLGIV